MRFANFLKKHFDIEIKHEYRTDVNCTNDSGKDVETIYVYEKNNDCEPAFILYDSWWFTGTTEKNCWIVGNIYSNLEHGKEYTEKEIIELTQNSNILK